MSKPTGKISRDQAEEAVRVLLRYAGDDPAREGLLELQNISCNSAIILPTSSFASA